MEQITDNPLLELEAARVAVFVLEQAIGDRYGRSTPAYYLIVPSNRRLTADQAAEALVRIPKPTSCSARVERGDLSIACEPIGGSSDLTVHSRVADQLREFWYHLISNKSGVSSSDPTVLLRGPRRSVVTSFSAWDACLAAYRIMHTAASGRLDAEAREKGADAVITIGPPADARLE